MGFRGVTRARLECRGFRGYRGRTCIGGIEEQRGSWVVGASGALRLGVLQVLGPFGVVDSLRTSYAVGCS